MALAFLFDPNKQFQSLGGVNEVGGFLRVFLNGTDDRATTYKNFDGTLNEADIELDANGRAVVIVDNTKTYRLEVYNRLGGLMWTVSNFTAQGGSGGGGTPVSVEGTEGEVDVDSYSSGGILHFVVGLAQTIKDTLTILSSSVTSLMASIGLCERVSNKKDTLTGYEASTTDYPSIKAVVDFVNSAMQNMGGKLITDNGDPFTDSSDLPSTTPYNGVNIDDKDYAYVQNAGRAERWSATVVGSSVAWVQEYAINIPVFTPAQQAAIDSGATATKIGNYDSHIANTTIHVTTTEKNTWNAKQNAIRDLAEIRSGAAAGATALQPNGNGSNVTSTFTAASSRTNISSGENLSTIFGKIAKWFSDLKALAFKDNVSNSDISGTIADAHIASASTWNHKQNALPTSGTPSSTFAINVSGTARYSENVLPYYVSTDNDKSWLEVGTYKANNTDEMYTGITFAVKFRGVDGRTQSGFVWISVGEWKSEGGYSNEDIVCEYYTLGRRVKEPSDSVKLYVNILGTSVTDGVKIYAYLAGYSNISLTPLNVNKGTYTSSMTYLDSEPATKKEVTYCNLLRSTYGTAIGGSSTPIYVDEYGIPKPCSSIPTPQTESWSGESTATATGTSSSGMIRFYASLDLGHGWGDGTHGFINYEVNCTSSSRKGESVCLVSIVPGYVGSQGIRFLGYPFKFVENPPSYVNGTGVHICGIGDCWTGSLRTIPSRLIVQVDTDASKFSVGDTLGISVRVTATKLL